MRVAVLGLGSAGTRHCRHLLSHGTGVIVWDPDEARPAVVGVERARSFEQALESADAAIIASPSSRHAEQAQLVLARGLPVLVEKPLAATAAEAEAVARDAAEANTECGVAMNLRFLPALIELKSLAAGGELGRVMRAAVWFGYDLSRWRPETDYRDSYSARAELGGGIVLDAIHELDYLCWLLGPAVSVVAATARVSDLEIDVEDTAVAAIAFASGALATVDLDFVSPVYRRGCVLTGTDATATWDWTTGSIEVASGSESRRIETVGKVEDTYGAEVGDFLATVRGERRSFVPAAEGAVVVRLAEAIKRSSDEDTRVEL